MRISVYHNILWSKYKGAVFSCLYQQSQASDVEVEFVQIAETEGDREALGGVDLSYHQYPYRLLFKGAYSVVSIHRRIIAVISDLIWHPADLVVLPGFDRLEYWVMLLLCIVIRRKRAVFCDSTLYDRPRRPWKQIAKRLFFARCAGFLAYGIRSKEFLMSYGVPESRINFRCQAAALPHGYDAADVLTRIQRRDPRLPDAAGFIYIGRLSSEKGLDDLLAAFFQVLAVLPAATLQVAGAGPLADSLQARSAELRITESVSFLGSQSIEKLAELLMNADALVLPSHSEPWGLVVNEALSYGCPVVVSNICGCVPELVIDGETGYAYAVGDVGALSAAMIAAARLSDDRYAVAAQCINVIATYTPEHSASQILQSCRKILGL